MENLIGASLLLLLAVVLSGWIARGIKGVVPLPLVQIGLGGIIAAVTDLGIRLDPSIFFLFFLPPLLFLDGWRLPRDALYRDRRTVLALALGLVVVTVIGIGYFLHWMIPTMPLAVAFALAAVLSPTDPVAVGSIIEKAPLPRRSLHMLEAEALLNDASGLVCQRFAIAALATGAFSLADASATFLWLALAGLGVGCATTLVVTVVQRAVAAQIGEEPASKILVSLLLPFGAYLVAEAVDASGILAAVAAGITMGYAEQTGGALAETRIRRDAVWDMVRFALNGTMFVLIGEQLPDIVESAAWAVGESGDTPFLMLVHILVVTAALILLRLAWLWVAFRWQPFRRKRDLMPSSPRLLLVGAFAGARGSITIAGILALPLTVNGAPFPQRDLAIVIAAGVVILSIALAGSVLPWLLHDYSPPREAEAARFERRARTAAALAAIDAIEGVLHDEHSASTKTVVWMEAAARLSADYRARADGMAKSGQEASEYRQHALVQRELRLAALAAERDTYFRLRREGKITDDIARRLVAEVDQSETRLQSVALP